MLIAENQRQAMKEARFRESCQVTFRDIMSSIAALIQFVFVLSAYFLNFAEVFVDMFSSSFHVTV
jgi:hypothetical protein